MWTVTVMIYADDVNNDPFVIEFIITTNLCLEETEIDYG